MSKESALKWLYSDKGKPSTAKLNRQIAFIIATIVVLWQLVEGTLSTELFSIYITVFAGAEFVARWQKNKLGDFDDDNSGTAIRPEDEASRRDSGKSGKRDRTPVEGE